MYKLTLRNTTLNPEQGKSHNPICKPVPPPNFKAINETSSPQVPQRWQKAQKQIARHTDQAIA